MNKSTIVRTLAAAVLGAAPILGLVGCGNSAYSLDEAFGPPGASLSENTARTLRYAHYDLQNALEDVDIDLLMTRPASTMTRWDLVTMND